MNITAKRSYQLKIIKFFFWQAGFWVGGDTGRIFLFDWSMLWVLEIQVLIN